MEEEEPDSKYCSNCKKDISAHVFILHESHCRRKIVLCDTCGEPVPRTMMEEHMTEHEEVPCEQCRSMVARENMETHLEEECSLRMVVCPYCQLEVKANEFTEHSDPCGSRTDVCDKCNQRVMLKFMEEHHRDYCGKSLPEPSSHRHRLLPAQPQAPAYHDLYPPQRDSHASAATTPPPLHPYHPPPPYQSDEQPARDEGSSHQQPSDMRPVEAPLHNPTMVIDPDWLGSVANAVGERNLDSLLAETMSYETARRQSWRDRQMLEEETKKQQETDEEMARRLQRDYDIQGSYTAHDATLAQQLQGEDGPAVPVSPLQNELSEHYARQLQEEEDQNVMRVSGEQFDVRQRRLMEQRRLRQTNEQSGEYGQRTEEELDEVREQIREHRRRKQDEELRREEDDQRRRDERMQSNEELAQAAHDQPSYRLDPREDDNEQLRHQHAASGSYYQGTGSRSASDDEMDVEESAGGRVHHNEREHVNKNYDEISDIPCDLCGAAIPFEDYSRHLAEEHRRDVDDPYHAPIHHHEEYIPGHNFYERRSPSPPSPSPSPARSLDSSLSPGQPSHGSQYEFVQCRYCHQHFSVSIVSGHEALCDSNPDKHLKDANPSSSSGRVVPRPLSPPLLQPDHPFVETRIPCEFCEMSIPISVFTDHQETCTKRFTGHRYHASPYYQPDSGATAKSRAEEEDDLDIQIPCEHCYKLIPRSLLTRHQAICSIRSKAAATGSSRLPYTAKLASTARPVLHDLPASTRPLDSTSTDLPLLQTHQPLLVPLTSQPSTTSSHDVPRPQAPNQSPYVIEHGQHVTSPSRPLPSEGHSTHLDAPAQKRILPPTPASGHLNDGVTSSGNGLPLSDAAGNKYPNSKAPRRLKLAANFGQPEKTSSIKLSSSPHAVDSSSASGHPPPTSNNLQSFLQDVGRSSELPPFVQRPPSNPAAAATHSRAVHSDPVLGTREGHTVPLPTISRSALAGSPVQTDSVTRKPRTLASQTGTSSGQSRPKNRTQLLQTLPRDHVNPYNVRHTHGAASLNSRGTSDSTGRSLVSGTEKFGYGGADQSRPRHASAASSSHQQKTRSSPQLSGHKTSSPSTKRSWQ